MSEHKWIDVLVDGKLIKACERCRVQERDVGYLESGYCEKTPEAIEHREREEFRWLKSAHDCGRQEGRIWFESQHERWKYLSDKFEEA